MTINLGEWEEREIIVLRQLIDLAVRHGGMEGGVAQNCVALDAKIMAAVNAPKQADPLAMTYRGKPVTGDALAEDLTQTNAQAAPPSGAA